MKKGAEMTIKKKTLIASIVATAIWFVSFAVFIPLACTGKVPDGASRYIACVSVLFMIWVPFVLLQFKVKFDFTVLIVYQVFIFLATLVGSGWSVYQFVSWYDTVIHFSSGILIGFIAYTLISRNSKSKLEYIWLFVFIISFAMLCAGLWEIYEFTADCLTGSDMQVTEGFVGQRAVWDTMIDMICGFSGSVIAAVCCMFLERNRRKNEASSAEFLKEAETQTQKENMSDKE